MVADACIDGRSRYTEGRDVVARGDEDGRTAGGEHARRTRRLATTPAASARRRVYGRGTHGASTRRTGARSLRERTGAGMMDCKKALEEAGGDVEKAIEVLRVQGPREGGEEGGPRHQRGPDRVLHPPGQPHRRAGRGQLRDRLRGAHRRVPGARAQPRHAHRGRRAARGLARGHPRRPGRRRSAKSSRRRRSRRASPRRWSTRSSQGRIEKFYAEAALLDQPYVKDNDKNGAATS